MRSETTTNHSPSRARVLVVDDESPLRRVFSRLLEEEGHVVVEAADGAGALRALEGDRFDVVLSDISMPNLGGIGLLRTIRERDLDVPVILMTGNPSIETAAKAVELGALEYLRKPQDLERIPKAIERAVRLGRLARLKREAIDEAGGSSSGAGDRAGLEATFERALKGLWIAYQSLVRVDGRPYAHEALMRSREPALPHPGAVLAAAEKLHRLEDLGRHLRALSAVPVAANLDVGELFVNLHPRDLLDAELLSEDSPLTAIAPRVVLELTERASLEELGDVRRRVAALRERGFRIAIDDLGAGYAGLTSFATLEPEVVKLDMSLIRDVDKYVTKQKLVRSMAQLCHDLGAEIVAEGVETEAEFHAVVELGVDIVQGYLIARPAPPFPQVSWPPK